MAGWDGAPPKDILARFRADLESYPSVSLRGGEVVRTSGENGAFVLDLADGATIDARRVLLAHGVRDVLLDVPGLAAAWGTRVLHCPYCHGYEVRGGSLAVLAAHPMSAHQAQLLRADWSENVTLFTNGIEELDLDELDRAGVRIDHRTLQSVAEDKDGLDLRFADGSTDHHCALFVAPRATLDGSPAQQLGCALAEGPMGPFVKVGPMAQTSIVGVFAAGDVARPMPNINFALADGAQAGGGCHASLVFPGFVQPIEKEVAA